jgi:hypothetical protein
MAKILPLSEAVAELIKDGDQVACEGFTHLIPFSAGHEIIRQWDSTSPSDRQGGARGSCGQAHGGPHRRALRVPPPASVLLHAVVPIMKWRNDIHSLVDII